MRTIGRRTQRPISFSADADLLVEGARFNDAIHHLPTGQTTHIPKGIYRFKTHEEANRHQQQCLIDGIVRRPHQSPSPLAGEGLGRGGMEQREFAKGLHSAMTESERKLWRCLRAHRLNSEKFRRQQPIGPYVVDFVHFGARLIIEADGGQHNGAPDDQRRDA